MQKQKYAFTLVEILVVVVTIGVLAAALIPRLQTVQARERDTKRKADITQIGSALAVYGSDNGNFIGLSGVTSSTGGTAGLRTFLVQNANYLTEMPADNNNATWFLGSVGAGLTGTPNTFLQGSLYGFTTLSRNSISFAGIIVVARTETDGSISNWVTASGANIQSYTGAGSHSGAIQKGGEVDSYENNCISISYSGVSRVVPGSTSCTANRNSPDLRYIYVY